MHDFFLAVVDSSGGEGLPPCYHVAVGLGCHGKPNWKNAPWIIGHDCITHEEWDQMVDRLQKSLEAVRRKGHAKLAKCE